MPYFTQRQLELELKLELLKPMEPKPKYSVRYPSIE